jgi:lipoprotein signal peptidase
VLLDVPNRARRLTPVPTRLTSRASAQRWWLLTVLFTVGAADQATKAWAWRNLPAAHINSGAGLLFGPHLAEWYRDGVRGLLIDVVGTTLVLGLAALLLRRHRPTLSFLGVALVLSGWASNLADRLALHTVTAPGSARGVVDFLRWNGRLWNVADLAIIAGAALGVAAWFLDGFRPRRTALPPVVTAEAVEAAYASSAAGPATAGPPS